MTEIVDQRLILCKDCAECINNFLKYALKKISYLRNELYFDSGLESSL